MNDLILSALHAAGKQIDRAKIRGAVRSAVQMFWTFLFAQQWVVDLVDASGLSEAAVMAATMGALWWVADRFQRSGFVRSRPVLRAVMALLMGGDLPPAYEVRRSYVVP